MKTLKCSIIAVFCFFTLCSNAALITNLEIESVENNKEIKLFITAKGSGLIKISIWDKKKCLHQSEYEALSSFEKYIDFKKYKEGEYTLLIEDELFVKNYKINFSENTAKVDASSVVKSFKPYFNFTPETKKLRVNWLMKDLDRPQIVIRNNANDIIFEKKFAKDIGLQKQFDLRFYKKGIYHVTVKNKMQSHQYRLEI
ncbi:hypothetical protein [Portibacter marinus]|uniref:hypothetical protein n=1 Tax=Portibacter marinus TaxID=2898660 RepID=UPI001F420A6B|nr:hypothetical protein [Portibacter marinus]